MIRKNRVFTIAFAILASLVSQALAQEPEKHLTFKTSLESPDIFHDSNDRNMPRDQKLEFLRGEIVNLVIRGSISSGFHTFPINFKSAIQQQQGPNTTLTIKPNEAIAALWSVEESPPESVFDEAFGEVFEYREPFTWTIPLLIRPEANPGKIQEIEVEIKTQVCDKSCFAEKYLLKVPLEVSKKAALEIPSEITSQLKKFDEERARITKKPETPSSPVNPSSNGSSAGSNESTTPVSSASDNETLNKLAIEDLSESYEPKDSTLWSTIIVGMLSGLVSLATPCVFPMIPITVSTFLKDAEAKHSNHYLMAAIYSGTILLVLTLGGIVLVSALQAISQHWLTNVFLALVFFVFSLSLLGMFDLALPTWLTDLTYARQNQVGNNYFGMVFMALTFSLISFACVGPIYGGFISVNVAQDGAVTGWAKRILGPLAFSLAFALPFFILALFPKLLKAMPRSGSWMNSVKVVMGFLELAAMFKFIRAAELSLAGESTFFTYDLVLGIYVILAIGCGLYLLGLYHLPHDHGAPESISVVRLLFGLCFLSLGVYLFPGLFKDQNNHSLKPRGTVYAWTQAFLLPDESSSWNSDLFAAMNQSEKENKPLFIDFTGVTCSNCKLNEHNVFDLPRVREIFSKFVTVQLYTDTVPAGVVQRPDAGGATDFKYNKFRNNALPYYIIARKRGNTLYVLGKWKQGLISNPAEFTAFLEKQQIRKLPES